jgi:putative ABC transport system ATP-binding protein
MNKEVIIKTEKLSKSFSVGGKQQHVIKNLDMEIYKGDFTVIMGSSGAGKSTLLYALSGMDKPTLGSISYSGKEITSMNDDQLAVFRRKHCGFVFQQVHLVPKGNDYCEIISHLLLIGY